MKLINKKVIAMAAAAAMSVTMIGASLADTIQPLPIKTDIQHLEDHFVTPNIDYKGNGIMTLTLLENEQFSAETVKAIKVGDVIVSDGEETTVETLEWDGPDLFINRGTEKEMLLTDASHGVFERVMENDRVPKLTIGTLEQEIEPYMIMLDWVDPKTGEVLDDIAVRSGDELKALLESNDGPSFAVENVRMLFDSAGDTLAAIQMKFDTEDYGVSYQAIKDSIVKQYGESTPLDLAALGDAIYAVDDDGRLEGRAEAWMVDSMAVVLERDHDDVDVTFVDLSQNALK